MFYNTGYWNLHQNGNNSSSNTQCYKTFLSLKFLLNFYSNLIFEGETKRGFTSASPCLNRKHEIWLKMLASNSLTRHDLKISYRFKFGSLPCAFNNTITSFFHCAMVKLIVDRLIVQSYHVHNISFFCKLRMGPISIK
jgi:hypothetical protein